MRISRLAYLLLLVIVLCSLLTDTAAESEENDLTDDEPIEENPEYVRPSDTVEDEVYEEDIDDEEEESGDEDYEEQGVDKGQEAKVAIKKALAGSGVATRRTVKLFKKYRFKITIALAMYAFRKEIKAFLWHVLSKPVKDPKTGQIVRRPIHTSPTSILKILVFIDLMRRMQSAGGSGKASPLFTMLMGGNPALALFLSKLMSANTAYVPPVEQHFTFERINERYKRDGMALKKAANPDGRASISLSGLKPRPYNETIILMDLTNMDPSSKRIDVLRDEVSFLLSEYRSDALPSNSSLTGDAEATKDNAELEVVVLLESPGGNAADYALASQQILRLRNHGIKVTICVDKVAASGGYMIACTSSPGQLFAAPFAVLGSIGVVGQTVNIHQTLRGWGVQPLVIKSGRDKSPVSLIGEVTKSGIRKVQDMVDKTHDAFKKHVVKARPVLSDQIRKVATGDVWLGYDALDLGLIDRIVTSDEYIGERISGGARVLKLMQVVRPKYPFSRPTASVSLVQKVGALGILQDIQALLQRVSSAFSEFISEDGNGMSALTKAAGVSDSVSFSASNSRGE